MFSQRERLIKDIVVGVATPLLTLANAQERDNSLRPGSGLLLKGAGLGVLRVHGGPGSRALDMLYAGKHPGTIGFRDITDGPQGHHSNYGLNEAKTKLENLTSFLHKLCISAQ